MSKCVTNINDFSAFQLLSMLYVSSERSRQINGYNISQKKFEKLEALSNNIYNTIIVIDYFCKNQIEIEELNNIAPIVVNLKHNADILNAFFINFNK